MHDEHIETYIKFLTTVWFPAGHSAPAMPVALPVQAPPRMEEPQFMYEQPKAQFAYGEPGASNSPPQAAMQYGQPATVPAMYSAFNQMASPEVPGTVIEHIHV
jgi:hypothetical protein